MKAIAVIVVLVFLTACSTPPQQIFLQKVTGFCAGPAEEVLARSSHILVNDSEARPITEVDRQTMLLKARDFLEKEDCSIAYAKWKPPSKENYTIEDISNLTLIGISGKTLTTAPYVFPCKKFTNISCDVQEFYGVRYR